MENEELDNELVVDDVPETSEENLEEVQVNASQDDEQVQENVEETEQSSEDIKKLVEERANKLFEEKVEERLIRDRINRERKQNKELAKYFRPPKGDFDKESLLYLSNLGYKNIFWSMAHYDWDVNKQMSVEKTCSIVLNNLHNGAIMLMHSVSIANARSLPIIIDKAISEGYTFELLTAL